MRTEGQEDYFDCRRFVLMLFVERMVVIMYLECSMRASMEASNYDPRCGGVHVNMLVRPHSVRAHEVQELQLELGSDRKATRRSHDFLIRLLL